MGLLLVGFGVKDSIMTIGDKQYQSICLLRRYSDDIRFGVGSGKGSAVYIDSK